MPRRIEEIEIWGRATLFQLLRMARDDVAMIERSNYDGDAMKGRNIAALILSVFVCLGVGALGSAFTASSVAGWYPTLAKPWFTPPSWIFGPVWTVLYVMMGVAAFLVWRRHDVGRAVALGAFAVQLALNALWSPAFFGLRSVTAGMVVIALLLPAIAVTAALFFRRSKLAGLLMLPYLAWTSFAALLNAALLVMNR